MPTRRPKPKLVLRLYVAGNAPNSLRAIANARALCNEHFADVFQLEIVDLLTHPQRAIGDEIVVTPTLVKLSPPPSRRIIGSLDDASQVLLTLRGR